MSHNCAVLVICSEAKEREQVKRARQEADALRMSTEADRFAAAMAEQASQAQAEREKQQQQRREQALVRSKRL